MADLYQRLEEYQRSGVYPFHMPGHKRRFDVEYTQDGKRNFTKGLLPYGIDITEIEGFDNLTFPKKGEVFWQMCEDAKELYGTEATFPLVNGSTSGLMAAISAVAAPRDEIIIGRNCHKAVYRIAELLGLSVTYYYPEYDEEMGIATGINLEYLKELFEKHQTAKCVVVTSPTYEGVILDVCQISEMAHCYKIPVIVDEAHGAHLPFMSNNAVENGEFISSVSNNKKSFGACSALCQGADIVVQSLHKTLPALTQTAVLHVTRGAEQRVGLLVKRVEDCVHLFQSTSPSYPLLASIDVCFSTCRQMLIKKIFDDYLIKLQKEREYYQNLKHLCLLDRNLADIYGYDRSKLVFVTSKTNISGVELMCRLREEYQLELELGAKEYAIAMTSVCDTDEGWERLRTAIFAIDETLEAAEAIDMPIKRDMETPIAIMTIREAKEQTATMVSLDRLMKQMELDYVSTSTLPLSKIYQPYISADYVMCYPPGIPLLVPGESITSEMVARIGEAVNSGFNVLGLENGKIAVLI